VAIHGRLAPIAHHAAAGGGLYYGDVFPIETQLECSVASYWIEEDIERCDFVAANDERRRRPYCRRRWAVKVEQEMRPESDTGCSY
jgi:hypothetical protein